MRLFGLPENQVAIGTVVLCLIGIPFVVIMAMLPVWDNIGLWSWVRWIGSWMTPAIDRTSFDYRPDFAPGLHVKRYLVGSSTIVELIFLANLGTLLSRPTRKHAGLVWLCYDRKKLLLNFGSSALMMAGLWYILFVNWSFIEFMAGDRKAGSLFAYIVFLPPIIAFLLGHLTKIVAFGVWRDTRRLIRRI